MAPNKRARPSFSPPRPRKPTTKPKSRSTAQKPKKTTRPTTSKSKSTSTKDSQRRSRLVSPTPSASDSLGNASSENDESMDVDEDADNDDTAMTNRTVEDSPEPDYILAEVTHDSASSPKDPPIPLGLVHRILHSQFSKPDTTKISTDAREVVGKYIEVFVREAIMRCAYEKNEEGGNAQVGEGWLEVEDLEKVAVQLCLDF